MARSVIGLFDNPVQVDSVVGALRDAGFEPEQITVAPADEQTPALAAATTPPKDVHTHGGLGAWLTQHLMHRGVPHDHAQRYSDQVSAGRQLVTAAVSSDAQESDARNLMVAAGASEISAAADGKMIRVLPPGA
jgi:hypothetical protein